VLRFQAPGFGDPVKGVAHEVSVADEPGHVTRGDDNLPQPLGELLGEIRQGR
jgi:hypothetical protein